MISKTDVDSWEVADLIDSFNDTPAKKRKIVIPPFQRNLVWSSNQKKLLIDSIKAGLPVGAILLYNGGANEKGNNIYHLIDGLQRSTSIKAYTQRPTSFFDSTNLPSNFSNTVYKLLKSFDVKIEVEAIDNLLVEWVQNLKGFKETDGFSSFNLSNY